MYTAAERFMIEEFDYYYPNTGKLKVALKGYPQFDDLKPVAKFTNEEKLLYIRIVRFVDQWAVAKRAAAAGLIPLLDPFDDTFEIPEYINRTYLATINA